MNVLPVNIVILSFNTQERTMRCIKWLKINTKYPDYQVLVIDNASVDGSREALRAIPDIRLVENPINVGVSKGWNQGIEYYRSSFGDLQNRYFMLLNSDTLVASGWLKTLVAVVKTNKEIGIISYGDMTNPNQQTMANVENISFVCPLIRGEVFEEIGLFDERLFIWHSDILFCQKALAAGWRVVTTPENLVHHFGESSVTQLTNMPYLKSEDAEMASKIQMEDLNKGR